MPQTLTEKRMQLAKEARQYVYQLLPNGAFNKEKGTSKAQIKEKYEIFFRELEAQHRTLPPTKSKTDIIVSYSLLSAVYRKYEMGDCAAMSFLAIQYLKETCKLDDSVAILALKQGDHQFLAIGLTEDALQELTHFSVKADLSFLTAPNPLFSLNQLSKKHTDLENKCKAFLEKLNGSDENSVIILDCWSKEIFPLKNLFAHLQQLSLEEPSILGTHKALPDAVKPFAQIYRTSEYCNQLSFTQDEPWLSLEEESDMDYCPRFRCNLF